MRRKNRQFLPFTNNNRSKPTLLWFAALGVISILMLLTASSCNSLLDASAQIEIPDTADTSMIEPTLSTNLHLDKVQNANADEQTPVGQLAFSETSVPFDNPSSTSFPSSEINQPSPEIDTVMIAESSDLLYLQDHRLMRWDHMTGYTGMLVDNVRDYTTSASGKLVAILRSHDITANGVELFDIALFSFETMQVRTLIEGCSRYSYLAFSPDEHWIAYISPEQETHIYALQIDQKSKPIKMGTCTLSDDSTCDDLAWSRDSEELAWSDSEGIWVKSLDQAAPRQVQPNWVQITNPQGKTDDIEVRFLNLNWSPLERYIKAETRLLDSDVRWYTVIDTRRDRMASIPDSYSSKTSNVALTWLHDGSLLMIHPSGLDGMSLPIIKHWDIMDTHSNLLVSNATIGPISGNPPLMAGAQPGSEYIFTWLRQISENSIIFGVRQPGTQQSPVLYSLDLEKGQLEKIIDLPVETLSILWSPDGEGTLVRGEDALLLYIAFRNGDLFDLRPILGTGADDFTWLPPAPRQ